ncbi:MAG: penicillin-binding transpeptidase domain-containing protein [Patescibacteria group bacterium]
MRWFRSRRKSSGEITPDDIFLDSSNLPSLSVEQFEGRVEKPVSPLALWAIGVVFLLVAGTYSWESVDLQLVKGEELTALAEANRLTHTIVFAQRGVISDRKHIELAWNEVGEAEHLLRRYRDVPGLAHVVGYVRYPRADNAGVWWRTEASGVAGAELIFDGELAGVNGKAMAEIDANRVVHRRSIIDPPRDGRSMVLSIDSEMQSKLHTTIQNHATRNGFQGGAGVIIDVKTGEIIALASAPEFKSQDVVDANPAVVRELATGELKPFLNRAIAGVYAPGSIVKPFFAVAALNEQIISPLKEIFSPGFITIPNQYNPDKPTIIKDWRAHGWTAMRDAIAVSSDVYFFAVGGGYEDQKGLGISRLETYAARFGFGKETGIALPGEVTGLIPTPEWKKDTFNGEEWRLGDTYNTSIGQYGFQVTPLQAVVATAALANGGKRLIPSLRASSTPESTDIGINSEFLSVVREGMRKAVTSDKGTARSLNISGIDIAAKTGTAEVGARKQYMNSWVIGFWPAENPQYAFAVVLERAPAGTLSGAAPAMRGFFEWLIHRDDQTAEPVVSEGIDIGSPE